MDVLENKDKEVKLMKLLSEIGFLALETGLSKNAKAIFDGLKAVRPESELPIIGLASIAIVTGKAQDAINMLEKEALKIKPDSDLAKAYLGMSYKLDGHGSKAEELLKEVMKTGKDESALSIAKEMLAAR